MDQFDPNFPGLIEGNITNVAVIDPAFQGNRVIDSTQPFNVTVEWQISGTQVPIYLSGADPTWAVSVYAESIGPGSNLVLGTVGVNRNHANPCAGANCMKYEVTVIVPPGILQEHNPAAGRSGIYRLAAAVFLNSVIRGHDLIGFREGPTIQAESL